MAIFVHPRAFGKEAESTFPGEKIEFFDDGPQPDLRWVQRFRASGLGREVVVLSNDPDVISGRKVETILIERLKAVV